MLRKGAFIGIALFRKPMGYGRIDQKRAPARSSGHFMENFPCRMTERMPRVFGEGPVGCEANPLKIPEEKEERRPESGCAL